MAAVATEQQRTSLTRTLRVADELSLDNGRIVVRLEGWQGRRAIVKLQLDAEVKVDKPPKPAG